jgi:lysozyme
MTRAKLAFTCAATLTTLALGAGCSSTDSASEPACSSTGQALSVCAAGPIVKGVDVSTYQGTVTWSKVKAAGNVFGIARVSDGTTHIDATFPTNWAGMKSAGIIRGAYQFFRPGEDPIAQADLMVQKLGTLEDGDMAPVMDMETADGVAPATIQANMKKWLDRVQQKTGRTPIIYTAAFMSGNVGNGFSAYPLWVANYGVTCPTMPANWAHWKFWQSSSTGSVAGITGNVDVDEFNGTLADLIKFTGGGVTPPPADAGAHGGHDAGTADAGPAPTPTPVPAPTGGGDQGGTMGSGNPTTGTATPATDPCVHP